MATFDRAAFFERAAEALHVLLADGPISPSPVDTLGIVQRYAKDLDLEDLDGFGADAYATVIAEHCRTAAHRFGTAAAVSISNAAVPGVHGGIRGHLNVVVEDMPFVVASITGVLSRHGVGIHMLAHPTFVVERSGEGDLTRVVPGTAPLSEDAGMTSSTDTMAIASGLVNPIIESWVHIEIDVVDVAWAQSTLVPAIEKSLLDVAVAYRDWQPMRLQAMQLADTVAQSVPESVSGQVGDAERLLRWLANDNFTFLGFQEYDLVPIEGPLPGYGLHPVAGTALGILSEAGHEHGTKPLVRRNLEKAAEPVILVLTKANSRATVHRTAYLDYVGVKRFGADGRVTGEYRFLGLYASSLYTQSVNDIPVIDTKVKTILHRSGYRDASYSGRDVISILENYPRDELFQADVDTLFDTVDAIRHLAERRRTWTFVRRDPYERFVSLLVYLPRDVFTTKVRTRIMAIISEMLGAVDIEHELTVSESVLARLYFVAHLPSGAPMPVIDETELRARIVSATTGWNESLGAALTESLGADRGSQFLRSWSQSFPESYKESFLPAAAVSDVVRMDALLHRGGTGAPRPDSPLEVLRAAGMDIAIEPPAGSDGVVQFKLYRTSPLSLTDALPVFANLGFEVVDERPFEVRGEAGAVHLYAFGLKMAGRVAVPGAGAASGSNPSAPQGAGAASSAGAPQLAIIDPATGDRLADSFAAVWLGWAEGDLLDRLIVTAGLEWREVTLLRAYIRYLRQLGLGFSNAFIAKVLAEYSPIVDLLVDLFETKFDPEPGAGRPVALDDRLVTVGELHAQIVDALDAVPSLDADRVLRSIALAMLATVRTSYYRTIDGAPITQVAFKLDPRSLPIVPEPVPLHEIWVYSPQVEGVHLRFGDIARGGLRWSDRREDFRTEVLGLVKAQVVKNAVIIPTGAKGGFFAKRLPSAAQRDAWLAEGRASYQTFIRGLLDVTDNQVLQHGARVIVAPESVVRYDGDDPYLVVAADKGTATFSDTANAIAAEYGFWLGDAFASGGSNGYDHKAMGITARGAWRSVERHFREIGVDPETDSFTAIGIGDMSGDVFGNGMLLSPAMKLVAAFDHRHIFIDPRPNVEAAFAERRRLFELPRSSWADFDSAVLGQGGGVYPRTSKSIELSPEAAALIGVDPDTAKLSPNELIRALLTASVDLIYNGGIGTYVKAESESNADVGDRSNDAIRVNGVQIQARVIGEGGNLGLTQLGRVEASAHGVHLNTDAIDNSAGVDTSDHEVNIKLLLSDVFDQEHEDARNALLHSLTDSIGERVLIDNYRQNRVLGVERASSSLVNVYQRMMDAWEAEGVLARELEFLPSREALDERGEQGIGLYSPELCVLLSYAKIELSAKIAGSKIPDEPWASSWLRSYFPDELVDRFGDEIGQHALCRQIIATELAKDLVDSAGITFAYSMMEESSARPDRVARAWAAVREIFDVPEFLLAVSRGDGVVPTAIQRQLLVRLRRVLGRAVRWMLEYQAEDLDVSRTIERFAGPLRVVRATLPTIVGSDANPLAAQERAELEQYGVESAVAERFVYLLDEFPMLDIIEIAEHHVVAPSEGADEANGASRKDAVIAAAGEIASVYFAINADYQVDALLRMVTKLPRTDEWQTLSRGALRDDIYTAVDSMTKSVLSVTPLDHEATPAARIAAWEQRNRAQLAKARHTFQQLRLVEAGDISPLLVALRVLRTISRPGALAQA